MRFELAINAFVLEGVGPAPSKQMCRLWGHELGRPADSDEKSIWSCDPYLVKSPLAVAQDSARADYEIVDPLRDFTNVRRPDEHAERIVVLRHAPRPASRLRQMYLAAPTGHDDVIVGSACSSKSQSFPKRYSNRKVIAWDDSKRANRRRL